MISGLSALTPVAKIRARGGQTQLGRTPVAHDHHGSRPIVQRAAVAGSDRSVRAKDRFERRDRLHCRAWSWPIVSAHHRAIRKCDRCDLGVEDLVCNGLLCEVLGAYAELVLFDARNTAKDGDVLRRLTHRNVDIRKQSILTRIVPFLIARCSGHAAPRRGGKDRIVGVDGIDSSRTEASIARDAVHARGDEGMTLTGLDRVEGHPGGLHAGCTKAIDRCCWYIIKSELHGDPTRHIATLFITRLHAADVDVIECARVQRLDLVQRGADHAGCKIIWTNVLERALSGASDWRTGGRNDNCLGVFKIGAGHHDHNPKSRPMSSFMISFEPAQILDARASAQPRATWYSFM